MSTRLVFASGCMLAAASLSCGGSSKSSTPCEPGPVTLSVVTNPTTYGCGDDFHAKFTVHNGSCSAIGITDIAIAAAIETCDPGGCLPSCGGTCTYPAPELQVRTLLAGQSAVVLDLTGGAFTCGGVACSVTEQYTYTVGYTLGSTPETATTTPVDLTIDLPASCP